MCQPKPFLAQRSFNTRLLGFHDGRSNGARSSIDIVADIKTPPPVMGADGDVIWEGIGDVTLML